MKLSIHALDTLFVRDGKPFSMGEDNWADGIFPPPPSVFYGSIRSSYMMGAGLSPEDMDTDKDESRSLRIGGLRFLIQNGDKEEIYCPCPLDLVLTKNSDQKGNSPNSGKSPDPSTLAKSLQIREMDQISGYPFSHILMGDGKDVLVSPRSRLIDSKSFADYLSGKDKDKGYPTVSLEDYVSHEPKIGIAKDRVRGNSADGKLYRLSMKRPLGLGFSLDISGVEPSSHVVKLGAEGKLAFTRTGDSQGERAPATGSNSASETMFHPPIPQGLGDRFKLVLATPGIFENGSFPSWLDTSTWQGELHGTRVQLLTANIGNPEYLGGFDMKNTKPKAMVRVVPAGSVYYFEVLEGSADAVAESIHGKSIAEMSRDKEGFGIVYVGKV